MRKVYDREFKLNAVNFSISSGKKDIEIENDLGIGHGCLCRWKKEIQENQEKAFPGNGNPKDKEIYELKKKVADLELEREILKKAIAIFSVTKK